MDDTKNKDHKREVIVKILLSFISLVILFQVFDNEYHIVLNNLTLVTFGVLTPLTLVNLYRTMWRQRTPVDLRDWMRVGVLLVLFFYCYLSGEHQKEKIVIAPIYGSIVYLVLVEICGLQICGLEREEKAKGLKFNLGCGLARSSFQFLENVIKGKDGIPGNAELLRKWMKEEEIFENSGVVWASPKVLILFPEGKYPYVNKYGQVWGSLDELIKKEKEDDEGSWKIGREFREYEYTPSSGNKRMMRLQLLKLKDKSKKIYYTIIAENRSLIALCMMGKLGKISKDAYLIHFQVFMRELGRLLDEDPMCVGNYDFLHYRESESLNFSHIVLERLKLIEANSMSTRSSFSNTSNVSAIEEVVEDSVKKTQ